MSDEGEQRKTGGHVYSTLTSQLKLSNSSKFKDSNCDVFSDCKSKSKDKAASLVRSGYASRHYLTFHSELDQPEIQQIYIRTQNELQALARKIGELESEADEHTSVFFSIIHISLSLTDAV